MFSKRKKESLIYGIIGLGRFGRALAMELAQAGAELIVLDRDEEKIAEIREYAENAFITKTLDKKTLLETGIQNADIVVVCIGEQLDASILTTLNLSGMGVRRIIAKATSLEHGEILEKLGAEVVYPEHDMAVRLAHRLETDRMLDFIQLSEKINVSKLIVPDELVGKRISEINIRSRFNVNIIAIEKEEGIIETVLPTYEFCKKDILYVSGSKEGITRFSEL